MPNNTSEVIITTPCNNKQQEIHAHFNRSNTPPFSDLVPYPRPLLGTKCADGYTQVGYPQYSCDSDTGEIGSDVLNDANLTPYTTCVDSTVDICTSVGSANSANQLVDWTDITNIPLETLTNGSVSETAGKYLYEGE